MTTMMLIRALQQRLQALLPDAGVYLFTLPKKPAGKLQEGYTRYPFVVITPLKGTDAFDDESGTSAHISLLYGTQSEKYDDGGAEEVFHIMEQVRLELLKHRTLDSRYRLDAHDWEFFDANQPQPEWYGEAKTRWTLPTVLEEVESI